MRYLHRISVSASPEIKAELEAFGIRVESSGLVTFKFDESDDRWQDLNRWIARRRAVDFVTTDFSKSEIKSADWLELMPTWHCGYPLPKPNSFGYLEETYDQSDYCNECGIGLVQKAPFVMRGEPKWGRYNIMQLNWIFDEFFVTPALWAAIFEKFGVGHRLVLDAKARVLESVVQLTVVNEVNIRTSGLGSELCTVCDRVKYSPTTRGLFPAVLDDTSARMVKTAQFFGTGKAAQKRILISQTIAQLLEYEKIKGASVRPAANRFEKGNVPN